MKPQWCFAPDEVIGRWCTLKCGPRAGAFAVADDVDVRGSGDYYVEGYCRELNRRIKWNIRAVTIGEVAE